MPEGAIGTGVFAALLLNAFHSEGPPLTFEGATSLDGRRVFVYSFQESKEQSRYHVRAGVQWVVTGYTARVHVDAKTAELERLDVITDELPEETGGCRDETHLNFGIVPLGAGDYLLPTTARQRFIGREGAEAENASTFSACREFQAESMLTFGGEKRASTRDSGGPPVLELPSGLPVTVELLSAVRPGEQAAGDRIRGKLVKLIVDEHQKTLIAKGTEVEGTLMRVEMHDTPRIQLAVALRWERLRTVTGDAAPLALLPNRQITPVRVVSNTGLRRRVEIELPPASEADYGVFHVYGEHAELQSGFRSEWVTR